MTAHLQDAVAVGSGLNDEGPIVAARSMAVLWLALFWRGRMRRKVSKMWKPEVRFR